jgi:hypothetical protein
MNEAFIDLDELILLCRTKHSKKFIKEAIDCYRSGAFRSCIVSTWNAVVFDFIFKLKDLQLFGDRQAISDLNKFENLCLRKDYKGLWDFESNIPKDALEKFQLISEIERSDIQRLFEDRSRCAHPSMTSLEEPFEATAELARYHLRSAVTHLLQRPPVQGRAAYETILQQIKSEYFPTDVDSAVKHFQQTLLFRARHTLIKDIIIDLTVGLLTEDFSDEETKQHFAAINAIAKIHFQPAQNILNEKLSDIILRKVEDSNLRKVISYLANITFWDSINEPCQIKLKNFIMKIEIFGISLDDYGELNRDNANILINASHINFLKEAILGQLAIPFGNVLRLKKFCNDELINEIIIHSLIERLPEAKLDELLSFSNEKISLSQDKIQFHLKEAAKTTSLNRLLKLISINNIAIDKFIGEIIEEKIITEKNSLKEIITIHHFIVDKMEDIESENEEKRVLEGIDKEISKVISKLIEEEPFDDLLLLKEKYSYDAFLRYQIRIEMIKNVDSIVENFCLSKSFDSAGTNAGHLLDVFSNLVESNWEKIFNAYISNSQICGSRSCQSPFGDLVNKYTEDKPILETLKNFREKLNKFTDDYSNNLKKNIDLHLIRANHY